MFKNPAQFFVMADTILYSTLIILILIIEKVSATQIQIQNFERTVKLSATYSLKWDINFQSEMVTFEVTAQTLGFVGLGLSLNGNMDGADMVIGGVTNEGKKYFEDRHGTGYDIPKIDNKKDWTLLEARENGSHTILKMFRNLDTCDDVHDIQIMKDTIYVIWAIGLTDKLERHFDRGAKALNLLDPPSPPLDPSKLNRFRILVNSSMSGTKETVYWCTAVQAPRFNQKIQIIGFEVILESAMAKKYTHHLILHKCSGSNLPRLIKPFLNRPGGECYESNDPIVKLKELCSTYYYVWAKGGDRLLLPEHVGIPFETNAGKNEFFLVQVHYDNPNLDANIKFQTGVTIFYTSGAGMRPHDAGLFHMGHKMTPALTVPPNVKNFTVVGHCPTDCTQAGLPSSGIKFFNVLLHSHLNAKKLKLRHFRDGKELPWIAHDDNYDPNYQQNRALQKEVEVLPGDHLSYECTYDTTWDNPPSATYAGLSARHEMCETFMLYYPLINTLEDCSSAISSYLELLKSFGIENIEMQDVDTPIVTAPESLDGLTYEEVLNTKVNWTPQLVEQVQERLGYSDHLAECATISRQDTNKRRTIHSGVTNYPFITKLYKPRTKKCASSGRDGGRSKMNVSIAGKLELNFSLVAILVLKLITTF